MARGSGRRREALHHQGIGIVMNMVYNSSNFCVVQFSDFGDNDEHPAGGFEIMDKSLRREIFLDGKQAEHFKNDVAKLISSEPSPDEFDDFLANYSGLMTQPVALH
jgi:hypothetical protein